MKRWRNPVREIQANSWLLFAALLLASVAAIGLSHLVVMALVPATYLWLWGDLPVATPMFFASVVVVIFVAVFAVAHLSLVKLASQRRKH